MADKHAGPPATEEEQAEVAQERIAQLEERLRSMPKGRPFERGVMRFNLGVAYAESPTGDRQSNLNRALTSLEQAARLFDPATKPIEHARAQNMLGSTLRELGRPEEATEAFSRAVELVPAAINPGEHGAPMNNLGLALLDQGRIPEAIDAFTKALEVFHGPLFLRQRIDVLHNLGQALAASDDAGLVRQGIERYQEALGITDPQEFPYQWGLLNNSLGVAYTGVGESQKAAEAFQSALRVYTRSRWPFQHAIAKNNLALAHIQIGDASSLRRAVSACEDAILVLDVRLHRQQWEQVYRNLELAEKGLKELNQEGTRAEHFARLLAEEEGENLVSALRDRLTHFTSLPEPRRSDALTELDLAILHLPKEQAQKVTNAWLDLLMELPHEQFAAGLAARMRAQQMLDEDSRKDATAILDFAIQNELLAPQRIRVRDLLYELGYERPVSREEAK